MKNKKKRMLSLALAAALLMTAVFGGHTAILGSPGVSLAAGSTGETYVYLPATDLTTASRYGGTGLYGGFVDGFQGGTAECGNQTLLLQNAGDYVEYDLDLEDTVEQAVLKVHAANAVVSVKPAGGADFTVLTARNGGAANRGVNLFDLTTGNALSSGDKKFTVRISFGGATVVMNNLAVEAVQPELKEAYELNPLGESFLRQVEDVSAGASRYFDNGTIPTIHLHPGEYVTLRFDYDDTASEIAYTCGNVGAAMTGEVSADGVSWSALDATSGNLTEMIPLPADRVFYLRFSAKDAETFLKSLTLTPTYPDLPPEPVKEQADVYLPIRDLSNASRYGGSTIAENFNDQYIGGSLASNPSLLLQSAGDYVEYDINLPDDAADAMLKVYMKDAVVSVKPQGGAYQTLTARNEKGGHFDRNVAIYDLTGENALATPEHQFTVRIAANGRDAAVLNGLLVETEPREQTGEYHLELMGESFLRSLTDISQGATRYFADEKDATLFLHEGEQAEFFFDFPDETESLAYTLGMLGEPMAVEISGDGSSWVSLPAGGRIEETLAFNDGCSFYLRFTATGESFLKQLELVPLPKEPEPVEEQADVYLPIRDLSNASRYGGASLVESFNDQFMSGDLVENPSLLLQNAGDYVEYDVNLPDEVTSAVLKIYMKDAVVSVKPQGGVYQTLTARNEAGGHFDRNVAIYELTEENALAAPERQFTIRIAANGTDAAVLNGLLVETEPKEQAGEYQFDLMGESFLRSVTDISQGATRYFADQKDATLFLHQGESAEFFLDFPDGVEGLSYSMEILGEPMTVEISNDRQQWTILPAGGRIEHMIKLNDARCFYVRFTASEGESFLKQFSIAPAQKEVEEERDYVYLPVHDLTGARSFGGNTIVENFVDTFTGGDPDQVDNRTLLLEHAEDYVEYAFNLTDQRDSAVLKVYMKDAVVSVKPEGGQYMTLTALNEEGGSFDRGIALYHLDESNALQDPSRKFTVRIAGSGEAAVINGLVLDASRPELTSGWYELNPLGESLLAAVDSVSQSTTRYFHEGYIPTVFVKDGGQITFRLAFAPGGVAYTADYELLGAQARVQVSLDGKTWAPLKGRRVERALDMQDTGTFYIRFEADQGEFFLKSLAAARRDTDPTEYNANPNVPKDCEYIYFKPGTAEEEKYMFGLGDDYRAYFSQTNDGMGIDGHEGGYLSSLPENVRIFDGGRQITYEFDLKDELTSARLKLYALADMDFFVSSDEGDSWEKLTPDSAPTGSGRGYYIFSLNQENALKNDDNRFRLKIQGTPFGRLFELMIENGAPALNHGVQFEAQSEDALRYLEDSSGLRSYYAYEAWPNYFLDEAGSILFKVPFAVGVNSAVLYATYSGGTRIEISTSRDGGFSELFVSPIGASGTPYTNTFDLSGYLRRSHTLYIRVTGTAQGAFVDSMGVAVTPRNQGTGGFTSFAGSEADYLYRVKNNGAGVGTSMRQKEELTKVRGLDVGGEVIYRFDLPENINGVDLKPRVQGSYSLTVSLDGESFTPVTRVGRKTDAIREQELLAKSSDKVLYVKIENTSTRDILLLYGLSYTVKGVPEPYQRPQTPDFDYNKSLPEHFPTVERLAAPKDPQAILAVLDVENSAGSVERGWIPAAAAAGAAALALGAGLGSWQIRKRRRRTKES